MSRKLIGEYRDVKIVCVGDGTVGKSSLLIQYCQNRFNRNYTPTIFDNMVARVKYCDRMIGLNLWDTAGQEDYDSLRPLSYQETDVFLLCFDVTNPTSFQNVRLKWYEECSQYSDAANFILCGCKTDLRDDVDVAKQLKERGKDFVSFEDAIKLKKELKCYEYIETSAKTRKNVDLAFISCLDSCFRNVGKKGGLFLGVNFSKIFKRIKKKDNKPIAPILPPAGMSPEILIKPTTYHNDFKKLIDNSLCSDIKFNVNGEIIFAHKVVLYVSCEFWKKFFTKFEKNEYFGVIEKYDEENEIVFLNSKIDSKTFRFLLDFFYIGYIKETNDDAVVISVEKLGKQFHIDDIQSFCSNIKELKKNPQESDLFKSMNLSLQSYILDERSKEYYKLFDTNLFADITLVLGEKKIQLHKAILCCRNEYFKALITTKFKESLNQKEIEILEDEKMENEFFSIIKFLYTSHTRDFIKPDTAMNIIMLSHKYNVVRLLNFCEVFVSKFVENECSVNIENSDVNVIGILLFSEYQQCKQLKDFSLHFISSNYLCFVRRNEWNDLRKEKELHNYVEKNRWPPLSYIKELEKYEKEMIQYDKKRKKKTPKWGKKIDLLEKIRDFEKEKKKKKNKKIVSILKIPNFLKRIGRD